MKSSINSAPLVPAILATCMCPHLCFASKSATGDSRMCIHEDDLSHVGSLPDILDTEIHAAFSAALITNNSKAVELVMQQLYKIFSHKVRAGN